MPSSIGVYFRVSRLKEQCDRVHVRKLMMKYGLKNVEVPQGADAEVKTAETIFLYVSVFLIAQERSGSSISGKRVYMGDCFVDFISFFLNIP